MSENNTFGCANPAAPTAIASSSQARPRPRQSSRTQPVTVSTNANTAGATAIPNRLGHNTPHPKKSHGKAGNATDSTPATASAAVLRPNSCRTNRRQDTGHTTIVMTAQNTLAATGIDTPVDIMTSDVSPCHAAG
jgi:hypothetical protein